mmetsp:Transcript_63342/g.200348  ORF Transcript_63342/g.200348 Transcript_63342/m.200348 type:complete len:181 (+) Transcript_63342:30-572(+)
MESAAAVDSHAPVDPTLENALDPSLEEKIKKEKDELTRKAVKQAVGGAAVAAAGAAMTGFGFAADAARILAAEAKKRAEQASAKRAQPKPPPVPTGSGKPSSYLDRAAVTSTPAAPAGEGAPILASQQQFLKAMGVPPNRWPATREAASRLIAASKSRSKKELNARAGAAESFNARKSRD